MPSDPCTLYEWLDISESNMPALMMERNKREHVKSRQKICMLLYGAVCVRMCECVSGSTSWIYMSAYE